MSYGNPVSTRDFLRLIGRGVVGLYVASELGPLYASGGQWKKIRFETSDKGILDTFGKIFETIKSQEFGKLIGRFNYHKGDGDPDSLAAGGSFTTFEEFLQIDQIPDKERLTMLYYPVGCTCEKREPQTTVFMAFLKGEEPLGEMQGVVSEGRSDTNRMIKPPQHVNITGMDIGTAREYSEKTLKHLIGL